MRTPLIGRGFGCFSRVVGPWADWPAGFRLDPQTPFGLAVGTVIDGGATGAIIASLTIDPPANLFSTEGPNFRVVVLRAGVPGNLIPFQFTERSWPPLGESDHGSPVLWSKIGATKNLPDEYAAEPQNDHYIFPNYSGPSCGPGEQMAVLYLVTSDEPSSPGYGSSIRTYLTMTVLGHYGKPARARGAEKETIGRSIPTGILG